MGLAMTLILTELSQAGIAMAADSAISKWSNGKLRTQDQQSWEKLLRVPRIKAGISYWGSIGLISKNERFDDWLKRRIEDRSYTDLRSFADYLAEEMNQAVNNKPLANKHEVGIHVAGFERGQDGVSRPSFYHIHNGHSSVRPEVETITVGGQTVISKTRLVWEVPPRELFTRHNDFSPESQSTGQLQGDVSYLTTNGDYATFHIIFEHLKPLLQMLNTLPDFSIPRRPNELGPKLGLLKTLVEITINLYKCSSAPKIIGGKVSTLGIRPDGTYLTPP
jgi:hypothetical protein